MEENNSEELKENVIDIQNEKTSENGIKIANDVIAVIAGKAASEVSGVYSMSGGFARRNIGSIWKKKFCKRNKN